MHRSPWHHPMLLALVGTVGVSLACGTGEPEGLEPEITFDFAAPRQVVVERGDTLSLIAEREGCSVEELQHWNQLDSDLIEVGQQLAVWETGSGDRAVPKDGSDRPPKEVVAAAPVPAPASKRSWNPLKLFSGSSEPEPTPTAPAPVPGPAPVAATDPTHAPLPEKEPATRRVLVAGAGVLGIDLDDGSADLEGAAAGMEARGSDLDNSGMGRRGSSFGDGGTADTVEVEGRQPGNYGGVQIPDTPVKAPRLARPAAKSCLRGPRESDLQGEDDVVTNQGLTDAQIRSGMSKVIRASTQCFPKGTSGSYRVVVELRVACTGVTDNARVVAAGPVPGHVTGCIEEVMGYAGFAAHARPDGLSFQYPLDYTF